MIFIFRTRFSVSSRKKLINILNIQILRFCFFSLRKIGYMLQNIHCKTYCCVFGCSWPWSKVSKESYIKSLLCVYTIFYLHLHSLRYQTLIQFMYKFIYRWQRLTLNKIDYSSSLLLYTRWYLRQHAIQMTKLLM